MKASLLLDQKMSEQLISRPSGTVVSSSVNDQSVTKRLLSRKGKRRKRREERSGLEWTR